LGVRLQPLPQMPPLEGRLALDYTGQQWRTGLLWRVVAPQHRVVFIEQILNTHAGLKMVVKCVARAPRKHTKPRARAEILAGDVTFVLRHAMLRRNHTPQ
jgi:hypothetical protein